MEKEQHKKMFFLLLHRMKSYSGRTEQKSCKYCFNKSLWSACSSMRCHSSVSHGCLHTCQSEVIPPLSHPKQAGQNILCFRQKLGNFLPQVHALPCLCSSVSEPRSPLPPRLALSCHLLLPVQRPWMPGSKG